MSKALTSNNFIDFERTLPPERASLGGVQSGAAPRLVYADRQRIPMFEALPSRAGKRAEAGGMPRLDLIKSSKTTGHDYHCFPMAEPQEVAAFGWRDATPYDFDEIA